MLLLLRRPDVSERILATRRSALVAYWPLWEPSGSVAFDQSGNGRNGAYTGVALGQPGLGDGRTAPLFDGVNDYTNVFGAGLAAAFPPTTGTFMVWVKPASAALWTNGVTHRILNIDVDSSNRITLLKTLGNNLQASYIAGGTTDSRTRAASTLTGDWTHVAMTWDKPGDILHMYINGVVEGAGSTSLGVWAGTIGTAVLGATDITPTTPWSGFLAHAALWNTVLSAGEIAQLARR